MKLHVAKEKKLNQRETILPKIIDLCINCTYTAAITLFSLVGNAYPPSYRFRTESKIRFSYIYI